MVTKNKEIEKGEFAKMYIGNFLRVLEEKFEKTSTQNHGLFIDPEKAIVGYNGKKSYGPIYIGGIIEKRFGNETIVLTKKELEEMISKKAKEALDKGTKIEGIDFEKELSNTKLGLLLSMFR